MRRTTIILPTYNEEKSIQKVIEGIFEQQKKIPNWELSVLVVDSKSKDKTESLVKQLIKKNPRLYLLSVEKEGLGKAYVQGFESVIENLHPFVIFEMDADLSHDPIEIPNFLEQIEKGADFVIGSRYTKGGSIPKDWGLHRKIFSFGANLIVRFGFMKLSVKDWTSGYRAIKAWIVKESLPQIRPYSGYIFQIALLDNAMKKNAIIKEVPIQFAERKGGVSKINPGHYIITTLAYIVLYSSFIKFFIVGCIGFVVDFALSYLFIDVLFWPIWIATVISAEAAIVSNFSLNNIWSFADKKLENTAKAIIPNFLKFNLIALGSILIQAVGLELATFLFGKEYWYIYKIVIIFFIIIPYSYFLYTKFIWKKKP